MSEPRCLIFAPNSELAAPDYPGSGFTPNSELVTPDYYGR